MDEVKGNKFPIGGGIFKNQTNFTNTKFKLKKETQSTSAPMDSLISLVEVREESSDRKSVREILKRYTICRWLRP